MSLTRGFSWSFLCHVLLLLFISSYQLLQPPLNVKVIPSMRVDLVALPQALSSTTSFGTAKEKEQTPPAYDYFTKSQKTVARLRSLENLSTSSLLTSMPEKNSLPPETFEGNQLSKGTRQQQAKGTTDTVPYLTDLQVHLQDNWFLPLWLQNLNLSAQVRLFIAPNGNFIRFKMIQSSGNTEFDAFVKSALEQSNPFPAPPALTPEGDEVLRNGVLIGFPI